MVASGGGVDCRVDQNKGLISIVENKLAATARRSAAAKGKQREAKGTRALAIACNMGGGRDGRDGMDGRAEPDEMYLGERLMI